MNSNTISKVESSIYDELLAEGINILQSTSSSSWTDYNEHDPGVTLLENLVFALTELVNKTNQPIQNILIQSPGMKLQPGDNAFYTAHEIFTISPITINDYRKLILDQVSNVKNVYINVINICNAKLQHNIGIKGFYNVQVEMYTIHNKSEENEKEEKKILTKVKELFNSHRNLCEMVGSISILRPLYLYVHFKIALINSKTIPEEILSRILTSLYQRLAPGNKFYTISELQTEGHTTETIFNGPKLSNGILLDDELTDMPQKIEISTIIKQILNIENIKEIKEFSISSSTQPNKDLKTHDTEVVIPHGYVPYLAFPATASDVTFIVDGTNITPDLDLVSELLLINKTDLYSQHKSALDRMDFNIPQGEYQDTTQYQSIRNILPTVYGVGNDQSLSEQSKIRQAQASQLKAYLLPIEQINVNYLAQLNALYTLYDPTSSNNQSYFTQPMSEMHQLKNIISDATSDLPALLHWNNKLNEINTLLDKNATHRLNEVSDNLLSRFGEILDPYSPFLSINPILPQYKTKSKLENDLKTKKEMIKDYVKLSYKRNRAISPTEIYNAISNLIYCETPTLIKKLYLILNIDNSTNQPITSILEYHNLHYLASQDSKNALSINLASEIDDINGDWLLSDTPILYEEDKPILSDPIVFRGDQNTLLHEILSLGTDSDNYEVKSKDPLNNSNFYLIFKGKTDLQIIHRSNSFLGIHNTLQFLVNTLRKIDSGSERIYLVEHILLAPDPNSSQYGFKLSISLESSNANISTKLDFKEWKYGTIQQRNASITQLTSWFCKSTEMQSRKNCIIESFDSLEQSRIIIKDHYGKIIAVSTKIYTDKTLIDRDITSLKKVLLENNVCQIVDLETYASYHNIAVNENFYSFKMSAFLPDWPARFQTNAFRNAYALNMHEQAPIHTQVDSYFLTFEEMKEFEMLYFQLMKQLAESNSLNHVTNAQLSMINFIRKISAQKAE